jgi:hypothetical protein
VGQCCCAEEDSGDAAGPPLRQTQLITRPGVAEEGVADSSEDAEDASGGEEEEPGVASEGLIQFLEGICIYRPEGAQARSQEKQGPGQLRALFRDEQPGGASTVEVQRELEVFLDADRGDA